LSGRKDVSLLLVLCLLLVVASSRHHVSALSIEKTTSVTGVIDGDTFDTSSLGRIRLADINAPEEGEAGYEDATRFLESLIENKEVYVDVDDLGTTSHDRIICVVYARHNATHITNVNKAMVDSSHAELWDHKDNEFEPAKWTLFNYYPGNTPGPDQDYRTILLVLILLTIVAFLVAETHRRR